METLDSILGSQGIAATLDTILIMQAQTGTKDVNLFVTGKDVEQQELALLGTILHSVSQDHPRCTQAAICAATYKQKSQVSKIVNQLIVRDLIRKKEGVMICSV